MKMVNRNTLIKKKNNNQWDNLFPITLTENVYDNNGVKISEKISDINNSIIDLGNDLNTKIKNIRLNVKDYGAVGDGITDDRSAIQSAIDDLEELGGTVFIPEGIYKIMGNPLVVPSNVNIIGDGDKTILDGSSFESSPTYTGKPLIKVEGSLSGNYRSTHDIPKYSRTVTLNTVVGLQKGDLLFFDSTELFDDSSSSTTSDYFKTDLIRIISINGDTVTFNSSVFWGFNKDTLTLRKMNTVNNVTISNIHIEMGIEKAHTGISVYRAENIIIENNFVNNCWDSGIYVGASYNVKVRGNSVTNGSGFTGFSAGYGVSVGAANRHVLVNANFFENNRHSVTGGGAPSGFIQISNNFSGGDSHNSFDSHETCFNWQFLNNKIVGSRTGIIVRGQNTSVIGNEIIGASETGIFIGGYTIAIDYLESFIVSNNRIEGCDIGIYLNGQQGVIKNASITSNNIKNTRLGLHVIDGESITISDNSLLNAKSVGIWIRGVNTISVNNNTLINSGGAISIAEQYGIWVQESTAVTILGNNVTGGSSQIVAHDNNGSVSISSNSFNNGGIYGLSVYDNDGVQMIGNTFINFNYEGSRAIRVFGSYLSFIGNSVFNSTAQPHDLIATDGSNLLLIGNIWSSYSTNNYTNVVDQFNLT